MSVADFDADVRMVQALGTRVPCTIVRGGSSKGVYVESSAIPPPGPERDALVLRLFGSPDKRQIDGLGGADKLTSKVAVMGPPSRADCDVDYLFGQVNIELPRIDWKSNCGNLSAGAAHYAVAAGYVRSDEPVVPVRIHQVNTGRRLLARVPLRAGLPEPAGTFAIGGVPGSGARIELDFGDFAGCTLGRGLLPTGNVRDAYDVPGVGPVELSVVDMANLCIFVRDRDVGLDDARDVTALGADAAVIARLESVRATVAAALGYISGPDAAQELLVRMNPLLFIVAAPRAYGALNGERIEAAAHDIHARSITRAAFSKAYPGTGSIGTAIACGIPGTVAFAALAEPPAVGTPYRVRIGHPGGTMTVRAMTRAEGDAVVAASAVVGRTARTLMSGVAYVD